MASSSNTNLMPGLDAKSRALIAKIVAHLKSKGNFDELRRDCLEELDKMEAFRQLNQRVESYVATFLSKQEWSDSLSKNQMRDSLRKHVCSSDALNTGAQRLVTQVIEKKSRAFQTRLEGIVQNFIYMDKEREKQERQSRFQNRYGYPQEYCSSKLENDRASSSEKSSTISDVSDIISQITHKDDDTVTKSEASASMKTESVVLSQQSSSSTHSKIDSSLSKQHNSGSQSKTEQIKHEKKADHSSPHDTLKTTPPLKINPPKRPIPTKRVIPRIGASQNPSSPSDKPTESPSNPRSKLPKSSHLSNVESHPEKSDEGINVEGPKKIDTTCTTPTTSVKSEVAKTTAVLHESTGKSSQDAEGRKSSNETGSGANQKQEDVLQSIDAIKDNTDVAMEMVQEEKLTLKNKTRDECEEQKIKEFDSIESEKKHPNEVQDSEMKVPCKENSGDDLKSSEDVSQESDSEESNVSDVSSVHTSDLSSFDGEVSSVSEVSDDGHSNDDESREKQGSKGDEKESKRNSKRKGNSNESELESGMCKKSGKARISGQRKSAEAEPKRKRGRPRKEACDKVKIPGELKSTSKRPRSRHHDDKYSSDGMHARDKSKRPIKKKRCYSPSSEGTREVCLPSKRSRVNSKD